MRPGSRPKRLFTHLSDGEGHTRCGLPLSTLTRVKVISKPRCVVCFEPDDLPDAEVLRAHDPSPTQAARSGA